MSSAGPIDRPDVKEILSKLKPFQRWSVDYVFDRFYGPDPTRRFLLADEVGLGKTWVAKGVVARAVDRLWELRDQIDIVYICSNQDISRQNIDRLNITKRKELASASRITLLPLNQESDEVRDRKLNFISFTPGTSFDPKSSKGISTERALLYHLLVEPWKLSGAAPRNVLQGGCTPENFRYELDHFFDDGTSIDQGMVKPFLDHISNSPGLKDRFFSLCEHYHRADARVSSEISKERNDLIGDLRAALARACLQSLKPDLIILDEFQRFKHLLEDDASSWASMLAHDLFGYSDANSDSRVLMLSATPYKMYTMGHEQTEDDHYADFVHTARFLFGDPAKTKEMQELLKGYRRALYGLTSGDLRQLLTMRDNLQCRLRSVMCRTERLAVTADRSGMLREIKSLAILVQADVASYVALQGVARALDHDDTMEYWKSSPYLLNFMEDYSLKKSLEDRGRDSDVIAAFLEAATKPGMLLPWEEVKSYRPIDSQNPRLRELMHDTVDCGAWQALWIAPSMPYYQLTGAFAEPEMAKFTKRLVFSSWRLVPKAIATLISYEVERRMITSHDPQAQNTAEAREGRRRLLNFARSNDRLTGMPVLGLMYPCYFLAQQFDPLRYMCENSHFRLTADEVLGLITMGISEALEPLVKDAPQSGPVDEAWYWAAPILLDEQADSGAASEWWTDELLAPRWAGTNDDHIDADGADDEDGSQTGWTQHVAEASAMNLDSRRKLGRPPKDLSEVLAQIALAGPAVTALRAISRVSGGLDQAKDLTCRFTAGKVAFGFRSLFNAPEVIALIRGQNNAEPYWRRTLEYGVDGCLQAVLDEYVHVCRDSLRTTEKIGEEIATALNLVSVNLGADQITADEQKKRLDFETRRLRAWFAMRFGDEKDAEGKVSRADHVRRAFNSPFWPFILITTSVGQEGLDFHTYCHAVVHWNLPSNPVDMEQREGRIHRFKGHAVRRNVARRHAAELRDDPAVDPWESLFDIARNASGDASGLSPYWVYTAEDGASIQRHVPALPLSREANQLPALRDSLAVYRMVFGQPRQDDLVEFLLRHVTRETLANQLDQLRINLAPPNGTPPALDVSS